MIVAKPAFLMLVGNTLLLLRAVFLCLLGVAKPYPRSAKHSMFDLLLTFVVNAGRNKPYIGCGEMAFLPRTGPGCHLSGISGNLKST